MMDDGSCSQRFIWTPATIQQHRGEVISRSGKKAVVSTNFRGFWRIGTADDLDIWQACYILNQEGATPTKTS